MIVSVLNREPMGMKLGAVDYQRVLDAVSVLNREPMGMKQTALTGGTAYRWWFQCSTASRWG